MDSDLNGVSPQFTLTCISTGGPATTVTWTRNSVPASGDMMTVFNGDTTAPQYTHTLNVTRRLGGKYTCTVSNDKPSSASASYNVPGTGYVFCSSNYLITLKLFCLLYCVSLTPGIHVYLTLNGTFIPNHGYVVISDIGNTALICNTNRIADFTVNLSGNRTRFHSGGDWHAPNGTIVGDLDESTVPGFERDRRPMKVRLHRNTSTGTPSEGIYYCVVEDDTFTEQTVYVGLYNNGGGIV